MDDFILTKHAQQRASDMALDDEFIEELLTHPQVKHVNKSPTHGDAWRYRRDDVAAIVSLDDSVIITFLPATEQRWRAEDATHPLPDRRFDAERWHNA